MATPIQPTNSLLEKWNKVISNEELSPIKSAEKRRIIARLLEHQELFNKGVMTDISGGYTSLNEEEAPNAVGAGVTYNGNPNLKGYDPVLIAMIRRLYPNLIAFDLCGVQPMNAPTGLIFALRSMYTAQGGQEALYREANTAFSGTGTHSTPLDPFDPLLSTGIGLDTAIGEQLGAGAPNANFPHMAFNIERVSVTAKTRALQAQFTTELEQDLKVIHGLDAKNILADICSHEINAEINREIIRTLYLISVVGAQNGVQTPGEFDLTVDSNGRWLVEQFKGLMYQMERDCNQIAKDTRRGKGNFVLTSSDVAAALTMAGLLDYGQSDLKDNLNVDDTGNTYVGRLNGRLDIYVDPYQVTGDTNFYLAGFKGKNVYDSGLFYCPYVPLQMFEAIDPNSYQRKMGFKTRYGLVANPFSNINGDSNGALVTNSNVYYRKVKVLSLI